VWERDLAGFEALGVGEEFFGREDEPDGDFGSCFGGGVFGGAVGVGEEVLFGRAGGGFRGGGSNVLEE